jgi:hypothetical protein
MHRRRSVWHVLADVTASHRTGRGVQNRSFVRSVHGRIYRGPANAMPRRFAIPRGAIEARIPAPSPHA